MAKVLISANITAGADPDMALSSLVPVLLLEAQAKEVCAAQASSARTTRQRDADRMEGRCSCTLVPTFLGGSWRNGGFLAQSHPYRH